MRTDLSLYSETWKSDHAQLLSDTYRAYFKTSLLPLPTPTFNDLFEAPFVLLSHGTEPDPIFNFANRRALELWQVTWDEMIQMPSRLSAEPMEQKARSEFMEEVRTKGFVRNYSGIRISKSGVRFKIEKAKVWNLIDSNNRLLGQAACFDQWQLLPPLEQESP